jgi:transcriptional regulator with XRE-family HTH domain
MNMAQKPKMITDQLRAAILAAPLTRYRIAQETGVSEAALSRFVNRTRGLDGSSIDILADYLGLELAPRAKRKAR